MDLLCVEHFVGLMRDLSTLLKIVRFAEILIENARCSNRSRIRSFFAKLSLAPATIALAFPRDQESFGERRDAAQRRKRRTGRGAGRETPVR